MFGQQFNKTTKQDMDFSCRNVANSFLLPVAMSPCRHYEMSQGRISWSAM